MPLLGSPMNRDTIGPALLELGIRQVSMGTAPRRRGGKKGMKSVNPNPAKAREYRGKRRKPANP